ncbi:TSUP family transporter [Candidatus Albibeggiatoa sp. nov. NOAA]|uniref:TSUP family transporter n=1 Tax=Candidatus Albibeggiatoa sp. nov. NOAA TaxID=3162724 RepID=UPI0033025555|nr:universal stress protein [Thiotrichaceae bacterium]
MEISFLDLTLANVLFLFVVGFIGGLVSGFIGSGGAFVLTPSMMSMGVPAIMAVASNMCHKFPKALVGSIKRARYGQVDVKLGIIMGISAEAGVLYGAHLQKYIRHEFGQDGSNLYVSFVFVVVLAIVGGYVLLDAWKLYSSGAQEEKKTKIAQWVQSVNIPGTMMHFKALNARISVLFTIPLGFATGMLAATIAVGGFIGVPAMMYILGAPGLVASATELVIAFIMGFGGTIKYALDGYVDVRLAMIILAGSLFGVQLGAIGTTYVKDYMVKIVMGVIMILVLFSRGFMIPVYLSNLGYIDPITDGTASILSNISFALLVIALSTGAFIILYSLLHGFRVEAERQKAEGDTTEEPIEPAVQLSPTGRFERIMLVTDGSEFSGGAEREAIELAKKANGQLFITSIVAVDPDYELLAPQLLEKQNAQAQTILDKVKQAAEMAGVKCETVLRQGSEIYEEIVSTAAEKRIDLIIMGRRGKSGLMRLMMGSTTARVIGYTDCNVLVTPRAANLTGQNVMVAVDGSRHGDIAAETATNLAQYLNANVTVVSAIEGDYSDRHRKEAKSIVDRVVDLMKQKGVKASGEVLMGSPATTIVDAAKDKAIDLIIMGSHGSSGFEKVLMGSVSDRVIGHAPCAVFVARG